MQRHEERKQTNSTLAYSDKFLTCRKEPKKATPNNWEKTLMGAARLHPSWCISSTLSTLQAWEENPLAHCILYALTRFDSRMHQRERLSFSLLDSFFFDQCPAARWVQSQALQLYVCTTGLCIAPRTYVTGGRLENRLFYLHSTPKEMAVARHTTCSPLDLGSWPLQPGSQLRLAGPTYFTCISDQTFQKCN